MAKYNIHACPDRIWYVNDYLVPSMLAQGISEKDITVLNDTERLGTLQFYLRCFLQVPDDNYGIWHLQDDVVISEHFKERTEQYDDGLVNGFCSKYCQGKGPGVVTPKEMWYSFPCLRIPNVLVNKFIKWYFQHAAKDSRYAHMVNSNKFIDEFFKIFIQTQYPNIHLRNLSPNLVDHVDYLLGGSTINASMTKDRRAQFWTETDVVRRLEYQLSNKR